MTPEIEAIAARGEACCVCGSADAQPWRTAPDNLLDQRDQKFQAVRCTDCNTVRLQPRPDETAMERHYTASTYARAEGEDETAGLGKRLDEFFRRQAERADTAHQNRTMRKRLLDVGCGDGRFLAAMQGRGWDGEGLETDPRTAALARHRSGATVHETYLENLTGIEGAFDMVSLLHVLEHVPDPRATLRAAFGALAPGGTLLLALPNTDCLEARVFGSNWYPLDLPRHYWGFTPRSLVRLTEETGFIVDGMRYLPFLFAPQSLRYSARNLKGRGSSDNGGAAAAAVAASPPVAAPRAEGGGLRTRLFLGLLTASEKMGKRWKGEVMELAAHREPAP